MGEAVPDTAWKTRYCLHCRAATYSQGGGGADYVLPPSLLPLSRVLPETTLPCHTVWTSLVTPSPEHSPHVPVCMERDAVPCQAVAEELTWGRVPPSPHLLSDPAPSPSHSP